MRKSSAQLELDYGTAAVELNGTLASPGLDSLGTEDTNVSSPPSKFPTFSVSGELFAAAARRAGRINAANISDEERDSLLHQRQALLDKQFSGTITRAESNRLEYVRWSLDRIDDARNGEALDALENLVGGYEQLKEDIQHLVNSLDNQLPRRKKTRNK
jgi:hypothetical protein